jgi:hypothetical protein
MDSVGFSYFFLFNFTSTIFVAVINMFVMFFTIIIFVALVFLQFFVTFLSKFSKF